MLLDMPLEFYSATTEKKLSRGLLDDFEDLEAFATDIPRDCVLSC